VSKLSPAGQSMAALFSPEGEKLRKAQQDGKTKGAGAPGSPFRIPTAKGISETGKSQDSLGNPNGPLGYEKLTKKSPGAPEAEPESKEGPVEYHVPGSPEQSNPIRLSSGWEKILIAQKKICEKAKDLFTTLEAPMKYRVQKKSSFVQLKSRGSILNLTPEETAAAGAPAAVDDKKKDAA
jgi:hypothetical protein